MTRGPVFSLCIQFEKLTSGRWKAIAPWHEVEHDDWLQAYYAVVRAYHGVF